MGRGNFSPPKLEQVSIWAKINVVFSQNEGVKGLKFCLNFSLISLFVKM